jgi:hypothetical protein
MDSLEGYVADDELAIGPLNYLGWSVDTVSWRDLSADWSRYEAVIIRTTWDYQRDPVRFLDVLESIRASGAKLENSLEVVRGNLDKTYLRSLGSAGVSIVPTIWDANYERGAFDGWLGQFDISEVVIKPTISATAENTFRLKRFDPDLQATFAARPFMVQPLMQNILDEGEFSLFYFGGEFSHAILKKPRPNDFRVQEEHGGEITPAIADEPLLKAGRKVVDTISTPPLYARVDFVRTVGENFALMELELIEPALYFRMDNGAPGRFAAAFDRRMNQTG